MLFGDGFEKTMKEHVEAMRCIRKTSNTKTESFFLEGPPPGPLPPLWGRQQPQRERQVPPVPKQQLQPECRKRKFQEEDSAPPVKPPKTLRVETPVDQTLSPEIVYAYENLPVLSLLPELQNFYLSITVNQLIARGIVPIARALAADRSISLAGRLAHCLANWQRVTQDRKRDPRVISTVRVDPLPTSTAATVDSIPGRGEPHAGGDRRDDCEGGHSGSLPHREGICVKYVLSSKEGRRPEASHQPKEVQRVRSHRTLQDGGNPSAGRSPKERRLDGESGSEGCILYDPNSRAVQRLSEVCFQRQMLHVQLPSVRPSVRTVGVHQDPETNSSSAQRAGSATDCLYRRHSDHGRDPPSS